MLSENKDFYLCQSTSQVRTKIFHISVTTNVIYFQPLPSNLNGQNTTAATGVAPE